MFDSSYQHLKNLGLQDRVRVFDTSSATVLLAAAALNTAPGNIAKSMAFDVKGKVVIVVVAGTSKIDNHKFKQRFNTKATFVAPAKLQEVVGHSMGGVCPFGIKDGVEVYLDVSLKKFTTVYPACGSDNSAVELGIAELEMASNSLGWVDVCAGGSDE